MVTSYFILVGLEDPSLRVKIICSVKVVVAQMAEWSLPIPEVNGSNPVINKILK